MVGINAAVVGVLAALCNPAWISAIHSLLALAAFAALAGWAMAI